MPTPLRLRRLALALAALAALAAPASALGLSDEALLRSADSFVPGDLRNVSPGVYLQAPALRMALAAPPTEAQAVAAIHHAVRAYARRHGLGASGLVATADRYYADPVVRAQFPDHTLRAKYLIGGLASVASAALDAPLDTSRYNPIAYDGTGAAARIDNPRALAETFIEPDGRITILLRPVQRDQPVATGASSLWHEILAHQDVGATLPEEQIGNRIDGIIEAELHLSAPSLSAARTRVMQAYDTALLRTLNSRTGTTLRVFRRRGRVFPRSSVRTRDFAGEVRRLYGPGVPAGPTPGNAAETAVLRRLLVTGVAIPDSAPNDQATLLALDRGVSRDVLGAGDIAALYRQLRAVPS